ncbi:MAG: 50S ribosomal protein L28 [Alphaproteobacteria bacterium]
MPRTCDITGKRTSAGSNVSHSNAHTKRVFKPNLHVKGFLSDILGRVVRLRVSSRALRTIDKYNGLDGFMLQVKNRRVVEDFTDFARTIRKEIIAKAPKTEVAPKAAKAKKAPAKAKKAKAE